MFEYTMCSSNLVASQGNRTIVASKRPVSLFEQETNVCKRPFLRDFTFVNRLLDKMDNIGHNSVANSFRTLGWISAGPKGFEGSRPFSNFVTPSLVTTMSSVNGG